MTVERVGLSDLQQVVAGEVTRKQIQDAQLNRDSVRSQTVRPVPAVPATPAAADQLSFSSEARALAAARQAVASLPEIRQQKADEIKRRVQEGTYKVDPRSLANSMIREGVTTARRTA